MGVANSKGSGSREVAGSLGGGGGGCGGGGGGRGDGGAGSGEPYVTLAGPDAVCVRAVFGDPSDALLGGLSELERKREMNSFYHLSQGKTVPVTLCMCWVVMEAW